MIINGLFGKRKYVPRDDGKNDADDVSCRSGELPCSAAPAEKAGGGDGDLNREREQSRHDAAGQRRRRLVHAFIDVVQAVFGQPDQRQRGGGLTGDAQDDEDEAEEAHDGAHDHHVQLHHGTLLLRRGLDDLLRPTCFLH